MSGRVSFSVAARILVNVEALNMAETVGNVSRHRRAPVVFAGDGGYTIAYVPAVSGMSLAYHYQKTLTRIAGSMGLPLTEMDKMGYFPKFSDNNVVEKYYKEAVGITRLKDPCEVEKKILSVSVVADVGGFLHTNSTTRRTSRIRFGYLVPAIDSIEQGAASTQPQMHVRYMPEPVREEQALFDVEQASSLYAFISSLDLTGIGEYSNCRPGEALNAQDRFRRAEAALKALITMLVSMDFGAKRSRYEPHWSVKSLVAVASISPSSFIATPPHSKSYLKETVGRARAQSSLIEGFAAKIFYYDGEGLEEPGTVGEGITVEKADSFGSALEKTSSAALEMLKKKLGLG